MALLGRKKWRQKVALNNECTCKINHSKTWPKAAAPARMQKRVWVESGATIAKEARGEVDTLLLKETGKGLDTFLLKGP